MMIMQNSPETAIKTLMIRALMAFVAVVSAPAVSLADSSADAVNAPLVSEIKIEGLASITEDELIYLLGIEKDKQLDPRAATSGIKRAFLKGIFEDISISTTGIGESIVIVKVREKDFVDEIDISGNDELPDDFIEKTLAIKEGDFIKYDAIDKKKKTLLDAIRQKGFPNAVVNITIKDTGEPYAKVVEIDIVENEPLIMEDIKITGHADEDEVLDEMELESGDVYDQLQLIEDMKNVTSHLRSEGYLNPVVGPYNFIDGVLSIDVRAGKKLDIKIEGNEAINTSDLTKVMPFYDAHEIRDDLVAEAIDRIIGIYHEKGYPFVQAAPVISEEKGKTAIIFYVFEGDHVILNSISIKGASIPSARLKDIMSLKEMSSYNPDKIESDAKSIRQLYVALGYINVLVSDPVVKIDDGWASMEINIAEGGKTLISNVSFEGASSIGGDELARTADIKNGDPYNETDISEAWRRLIDLYRSRGYYECKIDTKRAIADNKADIVFSVEEGGIYYFGKTIVVGNRDTRTKVLMRELQYGEGDPLNGELLVKSRQKLYKLGLFTSIETRPVGKKDAETDKNDVAVEIKEGSPGTVEFGLGYGEYEQYRGFIDVSYRNLFGMNRRGSFRTELNTLSSRYMLNFYEPWLFDTKIQSRTYFIKENRKEKNIDTGEIRYKIEKYTFGTGGERKLDESLKASLFYEYSIVYTYNVLPEVVLSREDEGRLSISSLSPGIVYDTRENPFDPDNGVLAGLTVKAASKAIASETEFVKITAQASTYQKPFKWLVVALGLKGGSAQGYGETEDLPLVERFYLGGRNTVRGYDQDTLGPKSDRGTPIGGNSFMLVNFELRNMIASGWRLVLFLDGGNVWLKNEGLDFDELKYTAGAGLQYNTPVGPVRLDYGHKLDREAGESRGELHFSLGHAF